MIVRVRVLFLAGLGRSGSTLLERTLDQLPDTVAVGELVHLWERGLGADERCGCGEAFSRCPFWMRVGELAYGGWAQVDQQRVRMAFAAVERTRHVPRLVAGAARGDFGRQLDWLRGLLARMYAAIGEAGGGATVVDSSKDPSYAYLLRGIDELDLRVVHAIRDAPAVAYSWSKVVPRPDAAGTQMSRWTPATTAKWWSVQNLLADGLRLAGVPVCRVRYEDFVRDPGGAVRQVGEMAGLVPAPEVFAGLARGTVMLGANHSVSGNPMRFTVGPVEIRRDEAWREAMQARDVRLVKALTLPVRLRFGYLRRPRDGSRVFSR